MKRVGVLFFLMVFAGLGTISAGAQEISSSILDSIRRPNPSVLVDSLDGLCQRTLTFDDRISPLKVALGKASKRIEDVRDCSGRTPFHWGAESGSKDIVEVLVAAAGDEAYRTACIAEVRLGRTALHIAAGWGHAGVVQALLKTAPDTDSARELIDMKDFEGETAIGLAADRERAKVVDLLDAYLTYEVGSPELNNRLEEINRFK